MVAKIATGEIEDRAPDEGKNKVAQELGRKGGKARAANMAPERYLLPDRFACCSGKR